MNNRTDLRLPNQIQFRRIKIAIQAPWPYSTKTLWYIITLCRGIVPCLKRSTTQGWNVNNSKLSTRKQAFYNQMRKCANEIDKFTSYQRVICGDFNAVVGRSDTREYRSKAGKNNKLANLTSDNGTRMLEFMSHRGLRLLNTFHQCRRRHDDTLYGQVSKRWTRIDYIATSKRFMKLVTNCRSYTGMSLNTGKRERNCWTDHMML